MCKRGGPQLEREDCSAPSDAAGGNQAGAWPASGVGRRKLDEG